MPHGQGAGVIAANARTIWAALFSAAAAALIVLAAASVAFCTRPAAFMAAIIATSSTTTLGTNGTPCLEVRLLNDKHAICVALIDLPTLRSSVVQFLKIPVLETTRLPLILTSALIETGIAELMDIPDGVNEILCGPQLKVTKAVVL